ncbi:MAG: MFS transporter [Chloroflexi bacterium]|nr:MFS transporter [Chloroflexota bacterium]
MSRTMQASAVINLTERLDRLPLGRFHFLLFALMFASLAFDHLDQVVISFSLPHYREEWGLSVRMASLNPTGGLAGTFIGALIGGMLGDRIGRKRTLLIGLTMFSTGMVLKGLSPNFVVFNIVCWTGALGVGSAIPLTFTLLAEYAPAKYRGTVLVTMGIMAIIVGYLIASLGALFLLPAFGWRALFLMGSSSYLIVILLAAFVPESPRFLLAKGKLAEAVHVVRRVEGHRAPAHEIGGAAILGEGASEPQEAGEGGLTLTGFGQLWKRAYRRRTFMLWAYAFSFGFFTFGFLSWLPSVLKFAGLTDHEIGLYTTLMDLTAIPTAVLTAFLFFRWSTKGLLVLYPTLSGTAMILLAALLWSGQMTAALVISVGAVIFFFGTILLGIFGPYAAEVYPTEVRGTGSGWATGFSRFGAFLAIPLGGLFLGSGLPLFTHQLIFGIPLLLAAVVMMALGIETRRQRLEDIA